MRLPSCSLLLLLGTGVSSLAACAPEDAPFAARPHAKLEQAVSAAVRLERAQLIRDAAGAKGITKGVLFAGIGQAETGLAHCDSEVGYGCPGPNSPTCGGAPILAGGADGPCSSEQGGLGMFQFDSGTYDQTLATYGDEVLTIEGNTGFAVEFMIARIILSAHVDNVDNREEAIEFINSVVPGGNNWNAWLTSVTHYYNGCSPTGCGVFDDRMESYGSSTTYVRDEFGAEFWNDVGTLPEPPVCEQIPAAGRTIEEDDDCTVAGGDPQYWRTEQDGSAGRLHWTVTTDQADFDNFAVWKLDFASAGRYEIEVYTDATFAESRQAEYVVRHAGVDTAVVIDQTAVDGFQSLGVFDFAAGDGQRVRLEDNTGEAWSATAGISLVFDALRVTPEAVEPPPDEPPPDEPPPDEPPPDEPPPDEPPPDEPEPEEPVPDEEDETHMIIVPTVSSSGCSSTSSGSIGGCALVLGLLGVARRRRVRAGP